MLQVRTSRMENNNSEAVSGYMNSLIVRRWSAAEQLRIYLIATISRTCYIFFCYNSDLPELFNRPDDTKIIIKVLKKFRNRRT